MEGKVILIPQHASGVFLISFVCIIIDRIDQVDNEYSIDCKR
jgi:hypothetical protein